MHVRVPLQWIACAAQVAQDVVPQLMPPSCVAQEMKQLMGTEREAAKAVIEASRSEVAALQAQAGSHSAGASEVVAPNNQSAHTGDGEQPPSGQVGRRFRWTEPGMGSAASRQRQGLCALWVPQGFRGAPHRR